MTNSKKTITITARTDILFLPKNTTWKEDIAVKMLAGTALMAIIKKREE